MHVRVALLQGYKPASWYAAVSLKSRIRVFQHALPRHSVLSPIGGARRYAGDEGLRCHHGWGRRALSKYRQLAGWPADNPGQASSRFGVEQDTRSTNPLLDHHLAHTAQSSRSDHGVYGMSLSGHPSESSPTLLDKYVNSSLTTPLHSAGEAASVAHAVLRSVVPPVAHIPDQQFAVPPYATHNIPYTTSAAPFLHGPAREVPQPESNYGFQRQYASPEPIQDFVEGTLHSQAHAEMQVSDDAARNWLPSSWQPAQMYAEPLPLSARSDVAMQGYMPRENSYGEASVLSHSEFLHDGYTGSPPTACNYQPYLHCLTNPLFPPPLPSPPLSFPPLSSPSGRRLPLQRPGVLPSADMQFRRGAPTNRSTPRRAAPYDVANPQRRAVTLPQQYQARSQYLSPPSGRQMMSPTYGRPSLEADPSSAPSTSTRETLPRQRLAPSCSGDSGIGFDNIYPSTIAPHELHFGILPPSGSQDMMVELEELRQETYANGNRKPDLNGIPDFILYGHSCRLDKLLRGDSCVPNADDVPFHLGVLPGKPSFRFRFLSHPQGYDRQVTVTTCIKGIPNPPNKGRLAMLAAGEMKRFLEKCEKERRPFGYGMHELYLLSINYTSQGSLQPRFGVRKL
ncbi:hypothetical protein C8T65DRAFT_98291 [Cerioporus squamosus]|nr:hypothetical protein C8T65DRAFT_98291 [Cerioporus squamosus]